MSDNLPERAAIVANKNLVQLSVDEMKRFAVGYARAGIFQGSNYNEVASPEDLFVRISAGQAIGLDPYTSVSEFYFVKGKLSMSTNLQLALAKASGKYDYRVEWGDSLQEVGVTPDDLKREGISLQEAATWPTPRWCRITVYSMPKFEAIGSSLWTLVDSHRAGLLEPSRRGEPSNHLKYPRAMMFNRAGSSAVAYYMPDATMIRAYEQGEVEGNVWDEPRGPSTVTAEVVRDEPEEEIHDAEEVEEPLAAGEMREGETPVEAMERMVGEEAKNFDPATEPPPPVVEPPVSAVPPVPPIPREGDDPEAPIFKPAPEQDESPEGFGDEPEAQPTVETSEHDPVISPSQRALLFVLCGQAGLTDSRRHEILAEVAGTPHADRVPTRLFDKVIARLNDEVELTRGEMDAVSHEEAPADA